MKGPFIPLRDIVDINTSHKCVEHHIIAATEGCETVRETYLRDIRKKEQVVLDALADLQRGYAFYEGMGKDFRENLDVHQLLADAGLQPND